MAVEPIVFPNFSGGLNTRDFSEELAPNEFPDSKNVTLDERGHIVKRLGYVDRFNTTVGTGIVVNLFYWNTKSKLVSQVGTGMYLDNGASFLTWTTNARAGMAEMNGLLFMNHPVDGLKYYDGVTVTSVPSAPKGNSLAVWQNILWSNDSTTSARLWFSPIGDPTAAWPGTNWVDLKEKDSAPITAMGGAGGMDVSGRPGLLVFKQDSAYRVHDSVDGDYTTLDPDVGCASNISLETINGRTYCLSTRGIFSTDGLSPMREDSSLIQNLFNSSQINQTTPSLYAAGKKQGRLFFSLPRAGSTANDLVIELHPEQHWVVRHTNAGSAYAYIGQNATEMIFGSTTANRIFNSHHGGTDNGAAIASSFRSSWAVPNGGNLFRVRQLRVTGAGAFMITPLKDFETAGSGASRQVNITGNIYRYDTGVLYDSGKNYGPSFTESHQDLWSIGVFRAISFQVDETSSIVSSAQPILGGASSLEKGGWELSKMVGVAYDLGNV